MTQSQKKAKRSKRCNFAMDDPKYLGLNRRVAERLGVHEVHVSMVRRGHRESGRVMTALREEMAKMDRERIAAERGERAAFEKALSEVKAKMDREERRRIAAERAARA